MVLIIQLIHFSNIISGFFKTNKDGVNLSGDNKKQKGKNTATAIRELENLGKDFEASKDDLQNKISGNKQNGSAPKDDTSGEIAINISAINDILLPGTKTEKKDNNQN